ncbi:MAG: glycosyltransferase family 9 protein [Candidatus Omnitrophota bacterium]
MKSVPPEKVNPSTRSGLRTGACSGLTLSGALYPRPQGRGLCAVERVKKILVMAFQGIGNILLLTPALEAFHQNFPEAKLTMIVGSSKTQELLEGCPYLERSIVYETERFWAGSFFRRLSFVRDLRKERFDITFCTFLEPGFKSSFLAYLTGAPVRVGYDFRGRGFLYTHPLELIPNRHEVDLNLDLVRALGGKVKDQRPIVWLQEEEKRWAEAFLKGKGVEPGDCLVGFHPGSSPLHHEKRWDPDHFAALADRMVEAWNARILIVGGEAEAKLAKEIEEKMRHPLHVAIGQTLKETAALLGRCRLFVSNDTGLSHLAAAVGIPVISIFGPTNPWKSRPVGESCVIIRKDLSCGPCYETWHGFRIICTNPTPYLCIRGIMVDEVFQEASRQLGKEVQSR